MRVASPKLFSQSTLQKKKKIPYALFLIHYFPHDILFLVDSSGFLYNCTSNIPIMFDFPCGLG